MWWSATATSRSPAGCQRVVIPGTVVLVPDRRRDGTNVLSRPARLAFVAEYGANSFRRHLAQAMALDSPVAVVRDEALAVDIDTVDDCRHPLVAGVLATIGLDADIWRPRGSS